MNQAIDPGEKGNNREPGRQEAKSTAARNKICSAVVECLVRDGYAETSINRVVEQAGVSKGALQHHFPSKEDLMAGTALHLLDNASLLQTRNLSRPGESRSVEKELLRTWYRGTNTPEFSALLEILIRMRTDQALRLRLSAALNAWHDKIMVSNHRMYRTRSGREEEVELLLDLNACVIRGLVIQAQYTSDPAYLEQLMQYWVSIAAPMLEPRG